MNARIFSILFAVGLFPLFRCDGAEPSLSGDNHTDFVLGGVTVNMPLPDHFVEGTSRSAPIKQLSDAGLLQTADSLGCYVDEGDLRRFNSAEADLPFWTKIVILKRLRTTNATLQDFAKIKADAAAKMVEATDPANPKMQEMLRQMQTSLSHLPNGAVTYKLPKPVNFGIVQSSDSSFTSLMLSNPNFKIDGAAESVPILTATTFLLCKNRLLFIYTCQRFKSPADVATLTHFVESWTRKIATAN